MNIINLLIALFAFVAAVLWLWSAKVKTPDTYSVHVTRPEGIMGHPLGGDPLGGIYVGMAHSMDFKDLANGLKLQSRLSAAAAICAGISALLQAVSVCMSL